jgi:hypothetical protein
LSNQRHLTPGEVCSRFSDRISVRTLAKLRSKGGGPEFIRIGGKIFYPIEKIAEWERSRTFVQTARHKETA